jgi:hypothetical protein
MTARVIALSCLTMLLSVSTAMAADTAAQFADLFGAEAGRISATSTKKDDAEFASKLLGAAKGVTEDKPLRAMLLQKTHEFGAKDAAGHAAAIAALDLFAKDQPEKAAACNEAALVLEERLYQASKPADRKTRAEGLAERVLEVCEQRVGDKKTADAVALLRRSLSLPGISGSDSGAVLQERMKQLAERQQAEKQAEELYQKLFANRNDAQSLARLVRLLLVELDSPAEAQTVAVDVKDESLVKLLQVLARMPETWTAEEAGQVAAYFEAQAADASPLAQRVALEKAKQAVERQMQVTQGELDKLKVKLAVERIAKSLETLDAKSSTAAKAATKTRRTRVKYVPGLVARLYPRHRSQEDGNLYTGWVPPEELGEPVGRPVVVWTLAPLKYPPDSNIVARGFLKIDEPGEYAFNAIAGHDRVALYINGEILCSFRDGEEKIVRVTLEKGMVPILVAGMVVPDGQCSIKWQPPGAKQLGPIPTAVMFYAAD